MCFPVEVNTDIPRHRDKLLLAAKERVENLSAMLESITTAT